MNHQLPPQYRTFENQAQAPPHGYFEHLPTKLLLKVKEENTASSWLGLHFAKLIGASGFVLLLVLFAWLFKPNSPHESNSEQLYQISLAYFDPYITETFADYLSNKDLSAIEEQIFNEYWNNPADFRLLENDLEAYHELLF